MINSQIPQIPPPISAVEIDKIIYELGLRLSTSLAWLDMNFGRAYKFIEKEEMRLYYPQVYLGNGNYKTVTPDNDLKGSCFFVVRRETIPNYIKFVNNVLHYDIGIVFNVNLKLINEALFNNELFTQNLISEVRTSLTKNYYPSFNLVINNVVYDHADIYQEFTVRQDLEYMRGKMQAFRFNCHVSIHEECAPTLDFCEALTRNLSASEKICILQSIDFNNDVFLNSLTYEQKDIIKNKL